MAEKEIHFPERPGRGEHYRGHQAEAGEARGQLRRARPGADGGQGPRGGGVPRPVLDQRR